MRAREKRSLRHPSSVDVTHLGVLGLLALGIRRLLLRLGLLESLARLLQLLGDLVGRSELLALGLLAILFSEEVVQVRHGDATTVRIHARTKRGWDLRRARRGRVNGGSAPRTRRSRTDLGLRHCDRPHGLVSTGSRRRQSASQERD